MVAPAVPPLVPPAVPFHPAVENWFRETHGEPSEPQRRGWPHIQAGQDTLIAAPTGSGKTLAAFLAAIDELVRAGLAGTLEDEVRVIYVSPLKALSNDIEKNLQAPLLGIRDHLQRLGLPPIEIRSLVRTGDTPAAERARLRTDPPHILVTTPESLYILLTSESGRRALSSVRTLIVDEIHAMVADKRGAHLALSLERLAALVGGTQSLRRVSRNVKEGPSTERANGGTDSTCEALAPRALTRVGLSATQKPIAEVARFLVGHHSAECAIVDCGHVRRMKLGIELPASPLEAVMSGEVWAEVYDRIADLVRQNTTTLVFVGNRRLAERLCRHLGERLGEERVAAHHGSLSKETRLDAERRLKAGQLQVLVATASLELGIDIGAVDLVCQVGSTRSIARLLQRVGRAGHQLGGVPDGKLFPLSRNDLVECAALLGSVRRGELDAIRVPEAPLDILAQQIVAMVACEDWDDNALFDCVRRAYPYRDLARPRFDAILRMLAEGFDTSRGRRAALVRHDAVTHQVQGRKAARLTALTNGGAIPDNTDYRVQLEPEEIHVGSIGEDFAIESMQGDIFQLGNASWRILKVETGLVRVADAKGQPPTIPFWLGEAPARSDELSRSVSRLKAELAERVANVATDDVGEPDSGTHGLESVVRWLGVEWGVGESAAEQVVEYLAAARRTLGALPTHDTIVVERFFDEAENTHLVVHSSFGARINRAWGLALRKRFCKTFNFELQAAATEDALILSLGPTHSFALESVGQFLKSSSAEGVLIQALLDAPMFEIRWRHNATRSLATPRFQAGKKVPAHLVRIRANDLLATAFPDQQACLENIVGEREIPDHPLVAQTIRDCLTEAMDVEGFLELLRGIERGQIAVLYRDLTEASPLAHEILNANPYAFLDPAPLEERRTQAVITRRHFDAKTARDLGLLDREAIERVEGEAWPCFETADELSDALYLCGFMAESEALSSKSARVRRLHTVSDAAPVTLPAPQALFDRLVEQGRATRLVLASGQRLWVGAERLAQLLAVCPGARACPALVLPAELCRVIEPEDAWRELVRGRLECLGPVTERALAEPLEHTSLEAARAQVRHALLALEGEGTAMRGHFTPGASAEQWCERGLLARIHRYTLERLRREIEPVNNACFMRFSFAWQHVSAEHRQLGELALSQALAQLEGFGAAAGAWEAALLPARVADYEPGWLDAQCLSGQLVWGRLRPPSGTKLLRSLASTPIVIALRDSWSWLAGAGEALPDSDLSATARQVLDAIQARGACFFHELGRSVGEANVAHALSELVAAGRISADSFSGMRGLLPGARRTRGLGRARRPPAGLESAGRWSLLASAADAHGQSRAERWARLLLRRYGVVFRSLLERENAPPWRDLLREYRRLEARGEVRGGRFVQRHAGEQFALPEAIPLLRKERQTPNRKQEVCLSACDPLNLVGTLLPGERVAAAPNNCILFRDALPIAALEAGQVRFLIELDIADQQRVEARLRRGPLSDEASLQPAARRKAASGSHARAPRDSSASA